MYEFEKEVTVYKFYIENVHDGSSFYFKTFYLQGSNDGKNFENLYEGSCLAGNNYRNIFTLDQAPLQSYKYYRIYIENNNGLYTACGEINFYYR